MISKPVALGLLAFSCVTAAAGGAYIAVRHNGTPAQQVVPATTSQVSPTPEARPVAETEMLVEAPTAPVEPSAAPVRTPANEKRPSAAPPSAPRASNRTNARTAPPASERSTPPVDHGARTSEPASTSPAASSPAPIDRSSPSRDVSAPPAANPPAAAPLPDVTPSEPPPPPTPQPVEAVVPASSVVGLKVETSLSSETARVEDRVEARVTRDVMADGRLAIPAGTRVLGDVTLVDRGGKMKDKARLGVRFHTLVLADGSHVPFRTDAIMREGSSPGTESARKIGGAAIGGAIIGAIVGGAKGAAIGGATGAGAGGAVVMAGDRNAATLPAGTVVTVRLNSPVTVDVEKEL